MAPISELTLHDRNHTMFKKEPEKKQSETNLPRKVMRSVFQILKPTGRNRQVDRVLKGAREELSDCEWDEEENIV